jgi:crotonobetainyl-CoA hydratase
VSVRCEIKDHVARVTIDRPAVLNAIDDASEARLREIWSGLEQNREVRAAVLTGAGDRAFCTGADVKNTGKEGLDYWAQPRPGGFGGISMRTTLDIPVVARVNGHALGGGFEMVLGCDIVVAAEQATFGLPEPRIGRLPLDGGMLLLSRQIPRKQAMGMLLTGRRVPAAVGYRLGFVNEVVPRAKLDEAVAAWVADIVACAPLSLRAIKQIVNATAQMSVEQAQSLRLPALIEALRSEDGLEGVRAFQQKRKPVWRGR